MSTAAPPVPVAVTWHDAECGGYAQDLPVWERLAAGRGPVLDLGAGTGRVALHLAERGQEVVTVDVDAELIGALRERAGELGVEIEAHVGDVRTLDLGRSFRLILAPMQLMHMLGGGEARLAALRAVVAHLEPGGTFAATILQEPLPPSGPTEALPDVRDVDGWIHSSLPLEVRVGDAELEIHRLRQLVAPDGSLSEELDVTAVDRLQPGVLEAEGERCGLRVTGSEPIGETDEHVGSLLLLMERADD
jgi:SAM-dependent methyltransferase